MRPKLLMACDDVPNYGGANTTFYILFETFLEAGWDVHYVNIIANDRLKFYQETFGKGVGNPKKLPNVHNFLFHNGDSSYFLRELINALKPDLMIGKKSTAAYHLKSQRPDLETWYITSSCYQIKKGISNGILSSEQEAIERARFYGGPLPLTYTTEIQAMDIVDKVICHTKSTRFWFNYFYPEHKHKISEKILWSAPLVHKKLQKQKSDLKEFENRPIDILFVANRWSRAEKNYKMVKQIIESCKGLNIHVVGECEEEIEGAVYHQFLIRDKVIELMKKTNTVVSTSAYDPAPNILFEASMMGCNVIASKNCGNWELCHPDLLVEPYGLENYIKKIHLSLSERFQDKIEYFLQDDPVSLITELINGSKVR
jgi:hypothetical protein